MDTNVEKGKAQTTKKLFSRQTTINIDIEAEKNIIWALLTNADDFPRWNSTIISLQGPITMGGKIKVKTKLSPEREFKLNVAEFSPGESMTWKDQMGFRVFKLKSLGNRVTNFSMTEKIGGPIFPLISKMIPSFDQSFEKYAMDLKIEAETISKTK